MRPNYGKELWLREMFAYPYMNMNYIKKIKLIILGIVMEQSFSTMAYVSQVWVN